MMHLIKKPENVSNEIISTDMFLAGMQDCKEGKAHVSKCDDYNRGYAAQYSLEESLSAGVWN